MRSEPLLLRSIVIEHDKSTFFVEMLEHRNGQKYVAVEQIVHVNNNIHHSEKIRINPTALDDIIGALYEMRNELSSTDVNGKPLSAASKQEIVRRYLKGLEIKDLTLQFSCGEKAILAILISNNVEIVSQQVPKLTKSKWRKRSK